MAFYSEFSFWTLATTSKAVFEARLRIRIIWLLCSSFNHRIGKTISHPASITSWIPEFLRAINHLLLWKIKLDSFKKIWRFDISNRCKCVARSTHPLIFNRRYLTQLGPVYISRFEEIRKKRLRLGSFGSAESFLDIVLVRVSVSHQVFVV